MTRQQPERAEQKAILDLLALVHAEVWVLGTTRKQRKPCPRCGVLVPDYQGTMQSPGLPDLLTMVPCPGLLGAPVKFVPIQVKAPDGRLSPAQQRFRAACERAGVEHLIGGIDEVLAWLYAQGHRVFLNC